PMSGSLSRWGPLLLALPCLWVAAQTFRLAVSWSSLEGVLVQNLRVVHDSPRARLDLAVWLEGQGRMREAIGVLEPLADGAKVSGRRQSLAYAEALRCALREGVPGALSRAAELPVRVMSTGDATALRLLARRLQSEGSCPSYSLQEVARLGEAWLALAADPEGSEVRQSVRLQAAAAWYQLGDAERALAVL